MTRWGVTIFFFFFFFFIHGTYTSAAPTPWGPFVHRAKTSQLGARSRFTLPEPVPVLDDHTGLVLKLSTATGCAFSVCLSHLLQMPSFFALKDWDVLCTGGTATLSSASPEANLFPRPGSAHLVMVETAGTECPIDLALSGFVCAASHYGPDCAMRTVQLPLPEDGMQLEPGASATFAIVAQEPFTARVGLWGDVLGTNPKVVAYGRQGTFARIVNDPLRYDATNTSVPTKDGATIALNVASPRQAYSDSAPIEYFFTFAAPKDAKDPITLKNVQLHTAKCPQFYHGAECRDRAFVLASTQSYPIEASSLSEDGWFFATPRFDHDIQGPFSFSVGVAPSRTTTQVPSVYLRLGDVPSKDEFDMRDASDIGANARFYASGVTDGVSAPWYIAVFAPNPKDRNFGLWFDTACADDCNGNGGCGTNHLCKCDRGFDGYSCATLSPDGPGNKDFDPGTTAAIIAFCVVGLLALMGTTLYYRRRKRQWLRRRMTASGEGYLSPERRQRHRGAYQQITAANMDATETDTGSHPSYGSTSRNAPKQQFTSGSL